MDSQHQMVEQSDNSIVNMAISLDPFSGKQALAKVDRQALEAAKKGLSALDDNMKSPVKSDITPKYSSDGFESESEEEMAPEVKPNDLDKYVLSLGQDDMSDQPIPSLQGTSCFGAEELTSRTPPDRDFSADEDNDPPQENFLVDK